MKKIRLKKVSVGSYEYNHKGTNIYVTNNDNGTWMLTVGEFGDENYWSETVDTLRDARETIAEIIEEDENNC